MLILTADDFLLPGALARAVSVLDAHPDIGPAICGWVAHRAGDALPPQARSLAYDLAADLEPRLSACEPHPAGVPQNLPNGAIVEADVRIIQARKTERLARRLLWRLHLARALHFYTTARWQRRQARSVGVLAGPVAEI